MSLSLHFYPAGRLWLSGSALALVLILGVSLPGPFQYAALGQRGNAGMGNYAKTRPAIVMVRTEYSANIYANNIRFDNKAFSSLLDSIQRLDNGGGVPAEQKLDIVLKEMSNIPHRFFKATFEYIKQAEQITAVGTGFFITSSGYVATNCHLIERDNSYIRRQFILSAFRQITETNIAALENAWATRFTEQQRNLLYDTYASVYSRIIPIALYDLKKNIFIVYRSDREDTGPGTEKKPATIVIKGQPMPGKDVAILKIETDLEMPALSLADGLPTVGEQLFVYGYPGPVARNDFVAEASAIEPTLTTGIVSAIRKSTGGWPLIQMDANINHGSSGGPVCNERGEVVGLTTFGSLENTGALAAGLNFAIPVSILNEYLDTAGILSNRDKVNRLFAEGLGFYEDRHYRGALTKFEDVVLLNKNYPGIYTYINSCKEQIKNGNDRRFGPVGHLLVYISLLLLIFGAIVLFIGSRWKRLDR